MKSFKSSDNGKLLQIFSLVSLVLSLLATLGRLASLLFFYDKIGYYKSGAPLPIISNAIFVLALVILALAAFVLAPCKTRTELSKLEKLSALVPFSALVVHFISRVSSTIGSQEPIKWTDLLVLVLTLCAAAFFVSVAFCSQPSSLTALCGIGGVFWVASAWLESYLDLYIPMNSPDKLFFHFACLGGVFFIFFELRELYAMPRPRLYLFSSAAAVLTMLTGSLVSLIANACDVFERYSSAEYDVIFTAIAIYASVRLFSTCFAKAPIEDPATDGEEAPTETEST